MVNDLTVIKCNAYGEEVFRWQGREIERKPNQVLLEAQFDLSEHHLGEMVLRRGDRLLETYFNDRWYNIFELYDHQNDALKGWYCNLSHPAEFGDQKITFRDLALDLIVYPDGRQELLDEDEFEALELSAEVRVSTLEALHILQESFRRRLEE